MHTYWRRQSEKILFNFRSKKSIKDFKLRHTHHIETGFLVFCNNYV